MLRDTPADVNPAAGRSWTAGMGAALPAALTNRAHIQRVSVASVTNSRGWESKLLLETQGGGFTVALRHPHFQKHVAVIRESDRGVEH